MKRWKKVLIWIVSVVVVLGAGGLFAANYAVDRLMNSMAESIVLDDEGSTEVVNDVPNGQGEPAGTSTDTAVQSGNAAPASDDAGSGDGQASVPASADSGEPAASAAPSTSEGTSPSADKPSDAAPSAAPTANDDSGYSAQVSTDKAKKIQDSVTVKDKADVASIVLGQLSMSDIKRLQQLASGGLTIEEKEEARRIILGKVSPSQYNQLSQIAKKYGVSRGITYDQAVAEDKELRKNE